MTFPAGVQTATLTFSNPITVLGNGATKTEMTVLPSTGVVWAETGQPIDDFSELIAPGAGMPGSLAVPVVDQPGFTDQAGNTFTMWAYTLTRETYFGNRVKRVTKYWQPLMGQDVADFDMLPGGQIGLPVSAPVIPVTSVAGETGVVSATALAGRLAEFLPDGVTPETVAANLPQRLSVGDLSATILDQIETEATDPAGVIGATVLDGTGLVNVRSYGAVLDGVTNDTAAVQAAANAARDQGRKLYLPAGDCRITGYVDVYTSFVADGRFVISAGITAAVRLQRTNMPITLTSTGLTGLIAGSSKVGGLGGVLGTLSLVSTEHLIERNNGVGQFYAKSEVSEIVKADGSVSPQIDNTYNSLAAVTATLYPTDTAITVDQIKIKVDGATASNDQGFLIIYRSNVTLNQAEVLNESGLNVIQGVVLSKVTNVEFNGGRVDKFEDAGSGYGVASYNTANTRYNDMRVTRCRHALSGRWNKTRSVTGGTYEGGIDDHWTSGLTMRNVQSVVSVGMSHVAIAGRDFRAINCDFVGGRNIVAIRADTPELDGDCIIDEGSWAPSVGESANVYAMGYSTTTLPFFDHGRVVKSPTRALVKRLRYKSPGDRDLTIIRPMGINLPHTYWKYMEVDGVASTARAITAILADKESAQHAGETVGMTGLIKNMDFTAAIADAALVYNTGDVTDGLGLDLTVENCKGVYLKLPENGMKRVLVKDSVFKQLLRVVISGQPFAGDYTIRDSTLESPAFNGTFLFDSRANIWKGAATSSSMTMDGRIKSYRGNLHAVGATGYPTHADGYKNATYYI